MEAANHPLVAASSQRAEIPRQSNLRLEVVMNRESRGRRPRLSFQRRRREITCSYYTVPVPSPLDAIPTNPLHHPNDLRRGVSVCFLAVSPAIFRSNHEFKADSY